MLFLHISHYQCIYISTSPEVPHLTILTHTHTHTHTTKNTNTCGNHQIPLQYSIKQLPSSIDAFHLSWILMVQTIPLLTQEPHNESLPTHPSFHPISEAMNPRESTWHTCCCSAFPVRPWKSTSQRLESSTGIYQCRTAPKKNGKLIYGFKHIYIYMSIYT